MAFYDSSFDSDSSFVLQKLSGNRCKGGRGTQDDHGGGAPSVDGQTGVVLHLVSQDPCTHPEGPHAEAEGKAPAGPRVPGGRGGGGT